MEAAPLLRFSGVTKRFPGVTALEEVDFDLNAGEVHALLGENGAGKSTLIKIMTGVHPADEGVLQLSGAAISPRSPAHAVQLGISPVYQEVNLVPNLSVAENVCLGREPRGPLGIRWGKLRARAEKALVRVGLKLNVGRPLRSCSIAVQQMVAIARALDVDAKVLVLDEPTSSLDQVEVEQLFEVVRKLKSEGLGIVFVTHFLDQVYAISDRITVLRNGRKVGTWAAADLPRLALVSEMIGRDASSLERPPAERTESVSDEAPIITARGLGRRGAVQGLDLDISPRRVLGLAGLLGSGRTETIRLLYGLDSPDEGELLVGGHTAKRYGPRAAIRAGLGLCAEDRKREGILPELTVRENLVIALQAKQGWFKRVGSERQRQLAQEYIDALNIRPGDAERQIQLLSGGNQQKVLLARWLAAQPRVLLLDEPTRGIDVGAKFEIMALVERLCAEGMAVVFVSSELAEVVHTCSRVVVLREGRVVELLEGEAITEPRIVQAIAESAA